MIPINIRKVCFYLISICGTPFFNSILCGIKISFFHNMVNHIFIKKSFEKKKNYCKIFTTVVLKAFGTPPCLVRTWKHYIFLFSAKNLQEKYYEIYFATIYQSLYRSHTISLSCSGIASLPDVTIDSPSYS